MYSFSRLTDNFSDQASAGGFAVSSGDGNDRNSIEPIRQLNFANDFDSCLVCVFKKRRMNVHSRTQYNQFCVRRRFRIFETGFHISTQLFQGL